MDASKERGDENASLGVSGRIDEEKKTFISLKMRSKPCLLGIDNPDCGPSVSMID
jgi:hypothetical protein